MTNEKALTTKVAVIGEALIDLVPDESRFTFTAHPGGSPYNVAIGLARLGVNTALMARLSDNTFGRMLRSYATREGVDLNAAPLASEPTTLAVVSLDDDAQATYEFYLEGTADWQWTESEIAQFPPETSILHFGSIASWTPPGRDRISLMVRSAHERDDVLISYDPNIRPSLLNDREDTRTRVESYLRHSHVAKASTDDVSWLYPNNTAEEVGQRWLELGPKLVVITRGPGGAIAFTQSGLRLDRPGVAVTVADTVGAGDSFTSGLIASLVTRGLGTPYLLDVCTPQDVLDALDDAICASAITCERPGADPPRSAELEEERKRGR
jgi:fructokinase